MGKIHLLLTKEEMDEEKMTGKIAVVFDVLLATSTITLGLSFGVREVIPVQTEDEAKTESLGRELNSFLLVGEKEGIALDGFHDPLSFHRQEELKGKTVILSTTNGTVAIRKASTANKVYIASLLNGAAVAEKLATDHQADTIVLVCSGSSGSFSLEDFYGAGYLLSTLVEETNNHWILTDSAQAALLFYQGNTLDSEEVLRMSRVGQMICEMGFGDEVAFVSQRGIVSLVPTLRGMSIGREEDEIGGWQNELV
ncbi:2-phosphosulfolactate phosphatase [Brevibacillus sp. SYSU BS000544]|uniref:2-phosphosulfolactate phosphatase n=1 Tax=Brevibacillus sp. SYSU BS000544 TaxID=3416443 RepID=UPI003CE476FB